MDFSPIWTNPFSAMGMFQLAAVTNFLSIFGHLLYGIPYYYPKFKIFPDDPEYGLAKSGSMGTWYYVSMAFFVEACLDWRWAKTTGPPTTEEEMCFWAVLVIGLIGGHRYFAMGYYVPLIPLWYANLFATCGYVLARQENSQIAVQAVVGNKTLL